MYGWSTRDIEVDDAMHTPDPVRDAMLERKVTLFSARGWLNIGAIVILISGLVTLFAAYPVISFYSQPRPRKSGFNLGGINGTGQIPVLPGLFQPIDPDTPQQALTKIGKDGKQYNLVFSDEFNTDGRTFYPGDDPYWEAADLNYWPTADIEWYSPEAITTKDGKLQITMTEQLNHDLNFQSGMLQSWNKFCFTTGIIEASISLPGDGETPGFWPGFWTMGNLGRPGYGATTDGTWPYSYDSCDAGALPNQTNADGTPTAATNTGTDAKTDFALSYLPGQRAGACTCPNVQIPIDHPGPSPSKGRGAPEIDIIEAQIDTVNRVGQASQSFQIAPFNQFYQYNNDTSAITINDPVNSNFNTYKGSITQQAVSIVSQLGTTNYGGNAYQTYGFEWFSDPNNRDSGFISWYVGDTTTWSMNPTAIGPDSVIQMSQRLIPEEAMSIIINFGMSPGFQHADFKNLKFPSVMFVDYVRVYQLPGVEDGVTCDPKAYPTADYIQAHINAYSNPNLTTWEQAGYQFPKNSKLTQC
ncbi:glycoside hydrolase family 16 protein [Hysterangium stoloniferum]|nr:glycoside hydrolase family 16 protein [Hysterangium stoloniferum]